MISSVFRYQKQCVDNLKKAYDAYENGDINGLSEMSGTFAKEAVIGLGKVCVRTIVGHLIETVTADTSAEQVVSVLSTVTDSKINIATVAVNGLAATVCAAFAASSWFDRQDDYKSSGEKAPSLRRASHLQTTVSRRKRGAGVNVSALLSS